MSIDLVSALKARLPHLIEMALAITIVVNVALCASYFFAAGHLPIPFFWDTSDTFMDWFNTAYWSNHPGAFDVWRTIYPPLSFVFLKLFSVGACYAVDAKMGRDCDWLGHCLLYFFYFLNFYLLWRCYRMKERSTAIFRTLAVALGMPMLFGLDRGNLVIPCFTCFICSYGGFIRSARLRWLFAALAINFKPYLVLMLAPHLVRRRWRWLEGSVIMVLIVYVTSYAFWGSGSPLEIFQNELDWSAGEDRAFFEALCFPSSFTSVLNYFEHGVALMRFVGSDLIETLVLWLPILNHFGQVAVIASFGVCALGRVNVPITRLAALSVAFTLTTTEVGGYAEVFLLFLVFFETWRSPYQIAAIIAAYLLCVPKDIVMVPLAHEIQNSYLSGRLVGYDLSLNVGMMARPTLILFIEYMLVLVTVTDAVKAYRIAKTARTSLLLA